MKLEKPYLSVIVPVHNTAPYVKRTVESIIGQSCSFQFEILLIENGSNDDSLKVIENLAKEYPQIRVMVSEKIGPSEARNMGIENSYGDLVTFVDSDDYIEPDMFNNMVKLLNEHEADAVYCSYIAENENGEKAYLTKNSGQIEIMSGPQCAYNIIMEKSTSSPCVRILKKYMLRDKRFPENMFYEDHDSIYKWMNDCKKVVYIDLPYYHYCIRSNGTTQSTDASLSKLYDRFNADFNRLVFIDNNLSYSPSQKKELIRHVLLELYKYLKKIRKLTVRNPDEAKQKKMIYDKFLQAFSNYPLSIKGLKVYSKEVKIRLKNLLNH